MMTCIVVSGTNDFLTKNFCIFCEYRILKFGKKDQVMTPIDSWFDHAICLDYENIYSYFWKTRPINLNVAH